MYEDSSKLPHAQQLRDLCARLSIPTSTVRHKATLSAAETQAVLPQGCLVQKTLTARVADRLVLWTGVGDFRISRRMHKAANRQLGLPAGSDHTLNPREVEPLAFYGMQSGMVSPFIPRDSPAARKLAALFVVDWAIIHDLSARVAISLSLTESLVISLEHLDALLSTYAQAAYGHLPLHIIALEDS